MGKVFGFVFEDQSDSASDVCAIAVLERIRTAASNAAELDTAPSMLERMTALLAHTGIVGIVPVSGET
jgi:hypothetical protein